MGIRNVQHISSDVENHLYVNVQYIQDKLCAPHSTPNESVALAVEQQSTAVKVKS